MKIAYLSVGDHIFDHRFLKKMVQRGYRPYLISCQSHKPKFEMEGVQHFHYHPRFPRMRLLAIVAYLRKLLDQIQPDILHAGIIQSYGFYAALTGFHPLLLMPWGSDTLHTPDSSWGMSLITRYAIKRADMIACNVELMKRRIVELSRYPEDKIIVFPWGVDLNLFRPGPSSIRAELGWEDKKVLIMTRNFYPIYGIEFFIEALPQIIKEESETRVILVGSGPLESHYRHRISELGLKDYIYFAGRVDEYRMSRYLNSADIYVTTTLSDSQALSLQEAMACRLPVVVSNAPASFEWVEDGVNGYIVSRGDSPRLAPRINEFLRKPALWYSAIPWNSNATVAGSSPLAESIIRLLKNPELRQIMGQRNYEIAQQKANWDQNFDKLERIYNTLATKKKAESH